MLTNLYKNTINNEVQKQETLIEKLEWINLRRLIIIELIILSRLPYPTRSVLVELM